MRESTILRERKEYFSLRVQLTLAIQSGLSRMEYPLGITCLSNSWKRVSKEKLSETKMTEPISSRENPVMWDKETDIDPKIMPGRKCMAY